MKKLPEKEFVVRNSLLIDLFENKHIRTIYHVFLATFFGLFVNSIIIDYVRNDGKVKFGLKLIRNGFGNFHYAFLLWICVNLITFLVFLLFKLWSKIRINLVATNKTSLILILDNISLFCVAVYYFLSIHLISLIISLFDLAPASVAFVSIEQIRLLMKVHSFIRTKAVDIVSYKPHSEKIIIEPKFSHFLYFLFAPTLIYRDTYPRTKTVRLTFILFRVLEIIGVVFLYSFVIDRFLNPSIQDFGKRKFTPHEIVLSVFENAITGIFILLGTFFLVLHSWQNLFAEILQFGDRLFYLDWWTSTSMSGYYRTWNLLVQDWLYTYIYKDMVEFVIPNNKIIAKLAVFTISAIIHEWILTSMFGFFFPVLFIEFYIFGTMLTFIQMPKNALFNILLWYSLALGTGISVDLYGIEFYARLNAPITNATTKDFFVPRSLTCDCIKYS